MSSQSYKVRVRWIRVSRCLQNGRFETEGECSGSGDDGGSTGSAKGLS